MQRILSLTNLVLIMLAVPAFAQNAPSFNPNDAIPFKKLPADFKHPGVFATEAALDRIREKVAAGYEPWKSAFDQLRKNPSASYEYKMNGPHEYIEGQTRYALAGDAHAAHLNAVMWNITRDERYAATARRILLDWANTCRGETADSHLQLGGTGYNFSSAVEILRWSYPAWTQNDTDAYVRMWHRKEGKANKSLIDELRHPYINNHGTVTNAGWLAVSVVAEDVRDYNTALERFFVLADRSNAGVYGNINPVTGQNSESNRDQGHSQGQISDLANAAQIMLSQGSNAGYEAGKDADGIPLLLKAFQFTACYNLGYDAETYRGWDMSTRWDTRTTQNKDNAGPGSHYRGSVVRMYEPVYNYYKYQAKVDPKSINFIDEWINTYAPDFGTLLYATDGRQMASAPVTPVAPDVADPAKNTGLGYGGIAATSFVASGGRDAREKNRPGLDNFEGRQVINCTRVGNYVVYKDVKFPASPDNTAVMAVRAATNNNSGELYAAFYADVDGSLKIEGRQEDPKITGGISLGRVDITTTGGWTDYKTFYGTLKDIPVGRKATLYMVFLGKEERGRTEWLMNVDWFKIAPRFAVNPIDVKKTLNVGDAFNAADVDFDHGTAFINLAVRTSAASSLELMIDRGEPVVLPVPNTRGGVREVRFAMPRGVEGQHAITLRGSGPAVAVESVRFTARPDRTMKLTARKHLATQGISDQSDSVRATDGGWMAFSPVNFGAGVRRVSATVVSDRGGTIEVRTLTRDGTGTGQPISQGEFKGNVGTLIAMVPVSPTDGRRETIVTDLPKPVGRMYMVFLVFKTTDGGVIELVDVEFDPDNVPPKLENTMVLRRVGEAWRAVLPTVDRDGDPITATLVSGPPGTTIDQATGEVISPSAKAGMSPVVIDLSDGQFITRTTVKADTSAN